MELISDTTLEEVVVVIFGKQSKRKVTDNIASVFSSDINNIPIASMQGALTGKAAGVQITQINGKVKGDVKMKIRGGGIKYFFFPGTFISENQQMLKTLLSTISMR